MKENLPSLVYIYGGDIFFCRREKAQWMILNKNFIE